MYEKLSANYYGCFVGPRRLFLVAGGGGGGDQRLHAMVEAVRLSEAQRGDVGTGDMLLLG